MELSLSGGESYTLTSQTIDKLIRAGDGDAALLYLYMLRTHGKSTDEQAAKDLEKGKGWVASATALLSRMGLIEVGNTGNEEEKPVYEQHSRTQRSYTQDEILGEMAPGSDFSIIAEETARRLGKPLSADDLQRLYGIFDDLGLPKEVILLLITHCISECRRRGDGRAPSMRYIEKAAFTWEREGIFSLEQAEEYLKSLEALKSARGRIKQILQIKNREFSSTEKRYVDGWIKTGFEPEVIELAYDKTIIGTGNLAYPYMDAILKRWDAKGLRTIAQVQGEDSRQRPGRNYGTGKHGEPTPEEIERLERLREKTKE